MTGHSDFTNTPAPPRPPAPWAFVLLAVAAGAVSFAAVAGVMWYRATRAEPSRGPAFVLPPATSPSPRVDPSLRSALPQEADSMDDRAAVAQCLTNLRRIAAALQAYANRHDWRLPDRLEDLAAEGYLSAGTLVCPSVGKPSAAPTGADPSYIYLGKGLSVPVSPDTIVLYEPARHYNGGAMHALFGDGGVRVIGGDDARQLLAAAAAGHRPLQYPATRPGPVGDATVQ